MSAKFGRLLVVVALLGVGIGVGAVPATAATTSLAMQNLPSSASVGQPLSFSLQAMSGTTPDPSYRGTVHLTSTDTTAQLPGDYTFSAADNGVHWFSGIVFNSAGAGTQTVTATDTATSALTATGTVSVVTPGPVTHFTVSMNGPAVLSTGQPVSASIVALDAGGHQVPAYRGSVGLSSSDAAAILPPPFTFSLNDSGSHYVSGIELNTAGTPSVTASDLAASSTTGTVTATVVTPGAASSLHVSAPSTAQVASHSVNPFGTATTVMAVLNDAQGHQATGYRGTVHITTTDSGATVPPDYTATADDAGQIMIPIGWATPGTQTVTVTDSANPLSGTATMTVVTPGPAVALRAYAPARASANGPAYFSVQAVDAHGFSDPGYRGSLHFTSTDPATPAPADYTFTARDAGNHGFPIAFKTAGSQQITVADATNGLSSAARTLVVAPGPMAGFTVQLYGPVQGASSYPYVQAVDANGDLVPSYLGSVALTTSDPNVQLPPNHQFVPNDAGSAGLGPIVLPTAGTVTLTATDVNTAKQGSLNATVVVPGPAAFIIGGVYSLGVQPVTGNTSSLFLGVYDTHFRPATGFRGTLQLATSDTQATQMPASHTFVAGDHGTLNEPVRFGTAGNQTVTLTAGAISGRIDVPVATPGAAVTLHVHADTPFLEGLVGFRSANVASTHGRLAFEVSAFDANGNIASGYLGTVAASSTDSAAHLPASRAFTATDGGTVLLGYDYSAPADYFATVGNQTVTFTDSATSTIAGSQAIQIVSPGAPTVLDVGVSPTSIQPGQTASAVVGLFDSSGNEASGYLGTVRFTSSDPAATVPADATFSTTDGGLRQVGVTLRTAGVQTVTGTDTATASLTGHGSTTVLQPGAPTHFQVSAPSTASAGSAVSVTVSALDANNVVASGYRGTARFSSSDTGATVPSNYTFGAADGGQHTFTSGATFATAGNQTITATDTVTASMSGTATVNVTSSAPPPSATALRVALAPNPATAGTAGTLTVTAVDSTGTQVAGYRGTVHMASSDSNATLPGDYTFTSGDGGSHSFISGVTMATAGAQTVAATDTQASSITGSTPATVNPGAPTHLAVSAPATATAGAPFTVTVTALDAHGNTATGYRGVVHSASSDGAASLPADYTFTAADGGSHPFTNGFTLNTAGAQSLTETDSVTSTITGSASVTASAPSSGGSSGGGSSGGGSSGGSSSGGGTTVAQGGSASSDPTGTNPTAANPLVATVTSPTGGAVSFTKTTGSAPAGYQALGFGVVITAPQASATSPLIVSFAVDASSLPPGAPASGVTVFRDGVPVADCAPGTSGASPDPCVASRSLSGGVLTIVVRSSHASTWTMGVANVTRVAGPDRIATSVAASQEAFPAGGAPAAVLSRSDTFADALAGTPLAKAKKGPLLLTGTSGLDSSVEAELGRAVVPGGTVYLLGGTAALSSAVADRLAALGYTVVRYGGADRYATATVVADQGLGNPATVLEATGDQFPDALAAGVAAAAVQGSVLLTQGSVQSSATAAYLSAHTPTSRYAVGGPAAAADAAATAIVGADRWDTAVQLARRFFSAPAAAGVVSGMAFPDALSGGAAVAQAGFPLLLVPPSGAVPAVVSDYLAAVAPLHRSTIFGGPLAVGDDVMSQLTVALANR